MSIRVPFGSVSDKSLEERIAETIYELNHRHPGPPPETAMIPDAGLAALVERLCEKTSEKTPQGWTVLKADLAGAKARSKMHGQYEEQVVPLFEGLEERGGVLNGEKVYIVTNDPAVQALVEAHEARHAPQKAETALERDVKVGKPLTLRSPGS